MIDGRPRVLLLESIHDDALALIEEAATVSIAPEPEAPPDAEVAAAHAIVTRGRGRIDAALIGRAPRLRVVARCGVGLDNVDVDAAAERGVTVLHAPGSLTTTVAEHTLMLILAAKRQLLDAANAVRANDWQRRARYAGTECAGATLGVIGRGAIGTRVGALATALGMRVLHWNRGAGADTDSASLDALLRAADVVSLHLALNDDTRAFLDAARIGRLRRGSIIVNTARAGLIDGDALRAALDSGRVGAYAADCAEPDPPSPDDPLITHPRAIVTPHVAALTEATYARMCTRVASALVRCLAGDEYDEHCRFERTRP